MSRLMPRAALYLRCVDDWKADYEVAALLGDTPPPPNRVVRSVLGRLIGRGLVEWDGGSNNTYRITEAGLSALADPSGGGKP